MVPLNDELTVDMKGLKDFLTDSSYFVCCNNLVIECLARTIYQIFSSFHIFCCFSLVYSLSNSRWHSANAYVIADVKSKIIVSRRHFFADVIFSATSKLQNYQNKTGEKSLYLSKYVLTTYFKEF